MTTNRIDQTDLRFIMTEFRDLARHLADAADYQLKSPYTISNTFYCAFLDDDSDYKPAALDMMRELMTALTDDTPDTAATELLARIQRDDTMLTEPTLHYSELPLDAPTNLPILEPDYND